MGKKSRQHVAEERKYIYTSTVDAEAPVFKSGKGSILTTIGGRKMIDFASNVSLCNTGMSPKEVVSAITQVARKYHAGILADWLAKVMIKISGQKVEVSRLALAKKLTTLAQKAFGGEWIGMPEVSGATTVNASGKICATTYMKESAKYKYWNTKMLESNFLHKRLVPRRYEPFNFSFLAFKNAFHGRHGLAQLLTDSPGAQKLWGLSSSFAVGRLDLPQKQTIGEIARQVDEELRFLKSAGPTLAFYFEPVQGEGGINAPDKPKMQFLMKYLRDKGVWTVADEIQTGLGRCGKMFACERLGINPDMILLSKSLGAGLPMGAILARKDIFRPEYIEPGMHSGSHHWDPITLAAGLANLPLIEKSLFVVNDKGVILASYLHDMKKSFKQITDIRGMGMFWGLEFDTPELRNQVIFEADKNGLLLAPCSTKTVRICPPINTETKTIVDAARILEKSIKASIKKQSKENK